MSISPDEMKRILELRDRIKDSLIETNATILIGGISAFLIAFMQNIPDHKKDEVRRILKNAIEP